MASVFDVEKAEFMMNSFAKSLNLACRLIDNNGRTISYHKDEFCIYENFGLDADKLSESFLYGANQANIYGGSYIFFSQYGFVHFTTPIISDNEIAGAFVAGPVLMTHRDEFLLDVIKNKSNHDRIKSKDIKIILDSIPIKSTRAVKAYADLLYSSAHYVSSEGYEQFETAQQSPNMQPEIFSYMAHLKTMGGETMDGAAYSIEKERELMRWISIGDKNNARRTLNEIMAHIYLKYGRDFTQLKSRMLELVVLFSRAAIEGGAQAEEIFGLNFSYLKDINDYHDVDQLTNWLSTVCDRFSASVFRFGEAKHQDSVYKSVLYIQNNYMHKLTLDEVAQNVHFSSAYFSKLFKDETGTTFNRYLNRVRITVGKELLMEKDMSLADISEAVGYHDQSHFGKNFKAITKMSPRQFREKL